MTGPVHTRRVTSERQRLTKRTGLRGRHLTDHRRRTLHWITSFLGAAHMMRDPSRCTGPTTADCCPSLQPIVRTPYEPARPWSLCSLGLEHRDLKIASRAESV